MAAEADKYELYQRSVQSPDFDLGVIGKLFQEHAGRPLRDVREDFCGTALLACEWVRGGADHRAWGVDIDPEPLAWGAEHNVAPLDPEARARVTLLLGDALDAGPPSVPPVDAVLALNYSFFMFTTRARMRAYFARAREGLREGGALVLELMGGPEIQTVTSERSRLDGFTYVWERAEFNPIDNGMRCRISFAFPDGSFLQAFRYEWRLWTVGELRELLAEAGYSSSQVYWEGTTPSGEGNGRFFPRERVRTELAWLAYVVGWR